MVINKKINMISKFLLLLLMTMISINMVNAVNIYEYTPQLQNKYMLYNNLDFVTTNSLLGNDYKVLYNMEFVSNEHILLFSLKNNLNQSLNYTIQLFNVQGISGLINFDTEIKAGGSSLFLLEKELSNPEKFFIGAKCNNCPSGYDTDVALYMLSKDESIRTTIFTPLINAFIDLIIINISLWQIAYYLIITGVIIGVFSLLIIGAYKFYVWADKLNIFERKRSNHKR